MKKIGMLLGTLILAVGLGCLSGRYLGMTLTEQWEHTEASQGWETTSNYQSMIEENLLRVEAKDAVPAYRDMAGFGMDAVIQEQSEDWKLVLVNKWNEMDTSYVPELTEVGSGHKVDSRIADALQDMIKGAKKAGYAIYILSSYRDMDKQISLYEAEVQKWEKEGYSEEAAREKAGTIVAYPGTSEHHLGLAVDLVSSEHVKLDQDAEKTKGYQWLAAHCQEYGFILRYPNNASDITGIIYEPWHFRYVGEEAATVIMKKGITLEEYLSELSLDR